MNWVTLIPLLIQGLTAVQPLFSGLNSSKVNTAGTGLIPVLQTLIGGVSPGSQAKVAPAVAAATSVFDPNIIKWIQQVLNLTGSNLEVDGELGPLTLAAAESFAAKELGIVPGGLISEILQSVLKWLATKQGAV
jgi:hypothetical protein